MRVFDKLNSNHTPDSRSTKTEQLSIQTTAKLRRKKSISGNNGSAVIFLESSFPTHDKQALRLREHFD